MLAGIAIRAGQGQARPTILRRPDRPLEPLMPPPRSDEDDLPKVPLRWATLREAGSLLRFLWPYRLKFAVALACLMLSSLVSLGFPYLAGNLVDAAMLRLRNEEAHGWLQDIN